MLTAAIKLNEPTRLDSTHFQNNLTHSFLASSLGRSCHGIRYNNDVASVTRWPDYLFNIWPFAIMKIWPMAKILLPKLVQNCDKY